MHYEENNYGPKLLLPFIFLHMSFVVDDVRETCRVNKQQFWM